MTDAKKPPTLKELYPNRTRRSGIASGPRKRRIVDPDNPFNGRRSIICDTGLNGGAVWWDAKRMSAAVAPRVTNGSKTDPGSIAGDMSIMARDHPEAWIAHPEMQGLFAHARFRQELYDQEHVCKRCGGTGREPE